MLGTGLDSKPLSSASVHVQQQSKVRKCANWVCKVVLRNVSSTRVERKRIFNRFQTGITCIIIGRDRAGARWEDVRVGAGKSQGDIHAENTGSATDIKDNLVLEEVGILVDGVLVGVGPDLILKHLLVDAVVVVALEVVLLGVSHRGTSGGSGGHGCAGWVLRY